MPVLKVCVSLTPSPPPPPPPPRFDVDFTEVHSYMTRGEAILQSPEFSVSRKDGGIQELHDKVLVKNKTCNVALLFSGLAF